jgi:hypothetical protein
MISRLMIKNPSMSGEIKGPVNVIAAISGLPAPKS